MTLDQYFIEVQTARWAKKIRYGQALYNLLAEEKPALADKIVGTVLDPYYTEGEASGEVFGPFYEFLLDNWNGSAT